MKGQRLIGTSILAIVAGLSIASVQTSDDNSKDTIGRKGVSAGTAYIREHFKDGDAIKVVPSWNEEHWNDFKNIGKDTKRFPFSALLRCDRCDAVTLAKPKRIWVLGTHGRDPKPTEKLFELLEPKELKEFDDGSHVSLYEMPDLDIKSSLSSSLTQTKVSRRDPAGKERVCKRQGNRFRCGKKGWENPSVETRDVFHNEVSWLLAHPPNNDETLVVRWPVLGGKALVVRAGFTLKAVRKEQGSSVSVKIFIDDKPVDAFELHPHRYHLELRVLPLEETSATIRFEIHADNHEFRQLMLEADTLSSVHAAIVEDATYNGLN